MSENNLPKGWVECSIGEIVKSKKGRKPTSTISEPKEGYVPYILIDEMEGKPIRAYTNDPKVSVIDESEVLLVWDGSIGKCGSGLNGAIGSTLVGLKAIGGIKTKFLEYTIKQQNNFIKETSTGTGLQHINKDFFDICKIPLPPLAEQERIVSKLDAVFPKIETNKQRLERIPKLLKRFRQSVLAAAVSGKLTEEWRKENEAVESIATLLESITKKKVEYGKTEYGWLKTKITDIFKVFGGGTPSRAEKSYWNGDISWVSSGDVKVDFILSGSETISKLGLENSSSKICPVNSVIVVVRSGILQHTLPVSIVGKELSINQDIKCFDSGNKILNHWLCIFLKGKAQEILSHNREGTTVQSVKMETLSNLTFEVPSIIEQQEIEKKVDQLFAFADKLEARYNKAKAMLDKLPQSLLAKAFRGELVPQNENDEPASVLLEKIKKEKQSQKIKPAKTIKPYAKNDKVRMVAEE